VLVLPFNLLGPEGDLQAAAAAADAAFGGAGIDYLIHNAGNDPSY
jgi:dehydrogenase/reductase SDR family protein 7